nr:ribonuclease H-like domain-containing protein [Tanacetum cinerariifolium]
MHQPPGFTDPQHHNHVCLLQRSLYGLKQAPRAWFQRFAGYAIRAGFYHSRCDTSLLIYQQGSQVAYLLIYVDDIILTASSATLLQQIITSLHQEFDMTDLGALNYFLGIFAMRSSTGLFLSQKKYACELLERANMVNRNPSRTPIDTDFKLGPESVAVQDPTFVSTCMTHGSLTLLPLNVSCGTSGVLWTSVFSFMLPLPPPSLGIPMLTGLVVHLHDALLLDIVFFLDDNLLSWSSKRQHTISRFSAEAEYRGVANVAAETAWLHNLLRELHSPLSTAALVIVIMLVLSICLPTQFNINEQNTLRLIYTSSVTWFRLVIFGFFMYLLATSMLISSPKVSRQLCLKISLEFECPAPSRSNCEGVLVDVFSCIRNNKY